MANEIKGIRVNGVPYKVNYPDLANKIAGDEKIVNIMRSQDVPFYGNDGQYYSDNIIMDAKFLPNIRQILIVTLDNKEYRCVVGPNGGCVFETGNGYLFTTFSVYGDTYCCSFMSDIPGTKKLKVDIVYCSTMDVDYLPYLHQFGGMGNGWTLVPEQTVSFNNGENTSTVSYFDGLHDEGDYEHYEYIVTWDDVKYYCRSVYSSSEIFLVDEYDMYANQSYDILPFYIYFTNDTYYIEIHSNGQETHKLKVEAREVLRMSSTLLPEVLDESGRSYSIVEALNEICSQAGISKEFHDEFYGNNSNS